MNFQYCSSCGAKIEYMLSAPNFCPSCGIHFNQHADAKTAGPPRPSSKAPSGDSEGTDFEHVPVLTRLEYDLDHDYSSVGTRKISLGDLLETPGAAPPIKKPVSNSKPKSERKRGRPRKVKPLTMEQKFEAVKGTIEECKSSADNTVDVEE